MVPELNDPAIRELLHASHRIIYRYREKQVLILAVWRASRPLDIRVLSEEI